MNDHRLDHINNNSPQFKDEDCIGLFCDKEGTIFLKIAYLNKIGRFCKYHSDDLISLGLATYLEDVGGTHGVGTTEHEYKKKGENDE